MVLYIEAIAVSLYIFLNYYLPFYHNLVYIIPIALTDIILAYVAFGELLLKNDRKRFHRLSRNLSLAAMAIALIAYLAAALVYIPI
jgi:hypothetical protein